MPARTTRHDARARIMATFTAELDRVIPADEQTPLKGATFADFEDRVESLARSVLPVILEERAALDTQAEVADAGHCPHCGSVEQLKDQLWNGQIDAIIATLQTHAERRGNPQDSDGKDHPRRVLATNVGYFQTHRHQMDYPLFRRNGWPIGSGDTESAVKLFNKR